MTFLKASNMIDLKEIKLVVSEMDGIITEGLMPIGPLGDHAMFKEYYFKDFEAINQIKRYFKFVFLAKDNYVNYNLTGQKQIPFFWSRKSKKHLTLLKEILPKYDVELRNIMYIGCSYSDEKCMELVAKSVCPADSPTGVIGRADVVLEVSGGCGVLMNFYDNIIVPNLSSL